MGWVDDMRAWPQRKKMNFLWITTGSAIVIMIIIWIVVGNYHANGSQHTASTLSTLISNIKNGKGTGK
jgi:hypothetical protein